MRGTNMSHVRDADTGVGAMRLNWENRGESHWFQELATAAYFPDAQQVKLLEYPRVEVQGNYIYIVHENGKKELWGKENRKSTSLEAARDIEPSLKAIKYGKGLLGEDAQRLHGSGIPIEHLDNTISQGYGDIKKPLKGLSEVKSFP